MTEPLSCCTFAHSLSYSRSLTQLGWIPFSRHGSRLLKVLRWFYIAVLNVVLITTFAAQIAVCYRRDGFLFTGLMINSSAITCEGEEHLVTNSLFQDGLLLASYWFGIYLFSGRGDSEHLFSLASRVGGWGWGWGWGVLVGVGGVECVGGWGLHTLRECE